MKHLIASSNEEEIFMFKFIHGILLRMKIKSIQYTRDRGIDVNNLIRCQYSSINVNQFRGISVDGENVKWPIETLKIKHFKVGWFRRRKYLIFNHMIKNIQSIQLIN